MESTRYPIMENAMLVISVITVIILNILHYLGFDPDGQLFGSIQAVCFLVVFAVAYRKIMSKSNPKSDSYDEYIRSIYDNRGGGSGDDRKG